MRFKRAGTDVFGTAFLDVISCGFAAVIMLLLLAKNGVIDAPQVSIEDLIDNKLDLVEASSAQSSQIDAAKEALTELVQRKQYLNKKLSNLSQQRIATTNSINSKNAAIERSKVINRTKPDQSNNSALDTEFSAGIPVGSEYILFMVDTSGSMRNNWAHVIREIEGILDIHPEVLGFQIVNDNGHYLLEGYKNRWIPGNKSSRRMVLQLFKNWSSFSNSNPVEGLEMALKTFAKPTYKLSIYVMGDDFTGPSYSEVINIIDRYNIDPKTNKRMATIHAIGFPWGIGNRFATLMREVTYQNNGVFVANP